MRFVDVLDHIVIACTFSWVVWVIFGSIRRYLMARSNVAIQEKVFARIDSTQSLLDLAANDSGRRFLESLSLERSEPASPVRRILRGIQVGIVLTCFGVGMLFLHHARVDRDGPPVLLVIGTGAIGLGLGFFIAAAVSLWFSRLLRISDLDHRG